MTRHMHMRDPAPPGHRWKTRAVICQESSGAEPGEIGGSISWGRQGKISKRTTLMLHKNDHRCRLTAAKLGDTRAWRLNEPLE
jgi:hypothetical protein